MVESLPPVYFKKKRIFLWLIQLLN